MLRSADTFIDALHSARPAPDRADKLGLYGFLIGSWETTVVAHEESGATHTNRGEIHAGWVLEGRALQDVWMLPHSAERQPNAPPLPLPVTGNWYGTTLRVYDPGIDAWHILWTNPAKVFLARQIGRARGADIVQEGRHESGALLRWSFTKIKPESFPLAGRDLRRQRRQLAASGRGSGPPLGVRPCGSEPVLQPCCGVGSDPQGLTPLAPHHKPQRKGGLP